MAGARRSLTTGFTLISRRLHHPSLSHLLSNSHDREESKPQPLPANPYSSSRSPIQTPFRNLGFALPLGLDPFRRSYSSSSSSSTPADGSGDFGLIKDVAGVLTDPATIDASSSAAAVAAAAPSSLFSPEVVVATADSSLPVAALQYLIDMVHISAGVNWWVAIVLTTILIRGATVPLLVNQLKATMKLSAMRPEMEELKDQMQNSEDPTAMMEANKKMKELFRKHGVTPLTPLKGLLIQGPVFISFFLAISNMVDKVPSFKSGGALWFTDLTATDPFYGLPLLTGLSFLVTVELNMQEGMEGNPMANVMKNFSRVLAFATIPLTVTFPKAIFCYWITSNLFSLGYGAALRRKSVRKFLNIPDVVPPSSPPPAAPSVSPFSFLRGLVNLPPEAAPSPAELAKETERAKADRRITSSAVMSQRIRNLEKQVKGRNKSKKM